MTFLGNTPIRTVYNDRLYRAIPITRLQPVRYSYGGHYTDLQGFSLLVGHHQLASTRLVDPEELSALVVGLMPTPNFEF